MNLRQPRCTEVIRSLVGGAPKKKGDDEEEDEDNPKPKGKGVEKEYQVQHRKKPIAQEQEVCRDSSIGLRPEFESESI